MLYALCTMVPSSYSLFPIPYSLYYTLLIKQNLLNYFVKTLLYIFVFIYWPASGLAQFQADSLQVHTLLRKGGQAARTAQYDSARYYYTMALEFSQQMNYPYGIMSSTMGYGLVHHFQREPDEALEYYLQALEMTRSGMDLTYPDIELLYNNLGGVYIDLGYRLKAKQYLEKALQLKELNNIAPISAAITHYNLGLINLYFGEYQSALHHFMTAYPGYLEHYGENGARVAQLYTNMGNIHEKLGNIEQAEQYFQRGIAIHLENHGPGYWNLAYPYTNLGALYVSTGRKAQALNYYLKSLDLCQKDRKELIRLEALNHGALAQYYLGEDNYQLSRSHANQAIAIMQEAFYSEHPRISEFYTTIGQTYAEQGDFEQARAWFDRAIALTVKGYGEVHPQLARLYLEQSRIYYQTGNHPKSLNFAQLALKSLDDSFEPTNPMDNPKPDKVLSERLLIQIVKHKADVYQAHANKENRMENLNSALEQYRLAALVVDHLRRGYLSESAKLFLQNNASEIYQQGIAVSYQLYHLNRDETYLAQAFFFMEKSKSSVLSEALQDAALTAVQGVDPAVIQQESHLHQLVKSLEIKLADAQLEENDSSQTLLKRDLFRARARVDSLENAIRANYPHYHQLKYDTQVLTLEKATAQIPDKALALSFFEADSSWYLLALARKESACYQVSKTTLPIDSINRFRQNLSNPESDPNQILSDGNLIYRALLQETLEKFDGIKELIVLPDGLLNYLPLGALSILSGDTESDPHYLVQDYAISYRNSLTLQSSLPRGYSYQQLYVGFAPNYEGEAHQLTLREPLSPLKGARAEVERAGSLFKGSQFLDQQATEHEFKNNNTSAAILHLAMHAQIDDEDPMRSRLLFTRESDTLEDGSLNAYEIYQLSLDAELAVLSACNTGIGKINKGEGVMSLSRAFMYAGCPNIVMSLWQAQDQATGQIMYTFFENLKKGLPKHEALQEAKLHFLASADPYKAHPANWATFVLLGDHQPLSRPNKPWLWIGLAALTLVLAGLYWQQRRKKLRSRDE